MTSTNIREEQKEIKDSLIQSLNFQIQEMQKVLNLIESQKWSQVDFQLTLKHSQEWKSIISKFQFGDCIPPKYIVAMKKLCKLAFQEGIQLKKEKLQKIKLTI